MLINCAFVGHKKLGRYGVTKMSMFQNLKLFIKWKIMQRKIYRAVNLRCTLFLVCVYRIEWRWMWRLRGRKNFQLNNGSSEDLLTLHKCRIYQFELCLVYAVFLKTKAFEKRDINWNSLNYNVYLALIITILGSEGHVETVMRKQLSTVYTEDGEEIFWFWFDRSH
jgi:hypothetical protein